MESQTMKIRRRRREKSTASNFVYCSSKQTNDKRIKRRKKYPISFHHYYVCYRIDFIHSLSIPSSSHSCFLSFFRSAPYCAGLLLMCHSNRKSLLFIQFIFRERQICVDSMRNIWFYRFSSRQAANSIWIHMNVSQCI